MLFCYLWGYVCGGLVRLRGGPGVDGEGAAPVEGACGIDLHHGFRGRGGGRHDAGAGAAGGIPGAVERHLAADDRQGRAGEKDAEDQQQARSEEHTSELQSLMRNSYAVFCLKKKKQKKNTESSSEIKT